MVKCVCMCTQVGVRASDKGSVETLTSSPLHGINSDSRYWDINGGGACDINVFLLS